MWPLKPQGHAQIPLHGRRDAQPLSGQTIGALETPPGDSPERGESAIVTAIEPGRAGVRAP